MLMKNINKLNGNITNESVNQNIIKNSKINNNKN